MTTPAKLRIFVSSVQKELEHERAAVAQLISVDPFLLKHCEAVLYDKEPPAGRPNPKAYLDCLRSCQIYLLIVDVEYGHPTGNLSATHEEYREAQKAELPTLVFIRGLDKKRDDAREAKTKEFVDEVKRDGFKYVRFHDREDLKPAVRAALYAVLNKAFHLQASDEESEDGEHLIEVASAFETAPMPDVAPQSLDAAALAGFVAAAIEQPGMRITLDEYPVRALREAIVNAVAHRNYEDASRKTAVQVLSDRIVVASPGYPPAPLTLARLRKGNYRACSRNPLIAQALATLKLMEQRGSGFARMRDAMLNHGLDAPAFAEQDGFFVVTFPGPNGNYDRIKTPESAAGLVSPAVEAQLNDRQKQIMRHVIETGSVNRRWCVLRFKVANDTAGRDLKFLTDLGLLVPQGKARAVRYALPSRQESAENRPTNS